MSSGQEKRHKNLMPLSSRGKRVRGYEGLKEKKIVNAGPASSEGEQLLQKGTVFDSEDGSSSHKIFHNSSSMSTINSLKYSHFKYAIYRGQAVAIISSEWMGHAAWEFGPLMSNADYHVVLLCTSNTSKLVMSLTVPPSQGEEPTPWWRTMSTAQEIG